MSTAFIDRNAEVTRYAVHLEFTDGNYDIFARAYGPDQAIGMAVIDARRMKPSSDNFAGKLLVSTATPAPE